MQAPSPATVSSKKSSSLQSKPSPTKPEKAKPKQIPTKIIIKPGKKQTVASASKQVVNPCVLVTLQQPHIHLSERAALLNVPNTTQSQSKTLGKASPHQSPNKKVQVTPKKQVTPRKAGPKKLLTPKKTDKKPKHTSNSSKKAAKNTAAKKQRNLMQKLCPGEKIFAVRHLICFASHCRNDS